MTTTQSWREWAASLHEANEQFNRAREIKIRERENKIANETAAFQYRMREQQLERMKREHVAWQAKQKTEFLTPMGIDEGIKGRVIYDFGRDVDWRTEEPAKLQTDFR